MLLKCFLSLTILAVNVILCFFYKSCTTLYSFLRKCHDFSVLSLSAVLPSLTLQLMNSTNVSCVELLCSLQGLRPQQVNFTWTRATQFLHHHPESRSMNSTLMLCKPNWTDRETLTCHASYSHNHIRYSKSITLPCNSGEPFTYSLIWTFIWSN